MPVRVEGMGMRDRLPSSLPSPNERGSNEYKTPRPSQARGVKQVVPVLTDLQYFNSICAARGFHFDRIPDLVPQNGFANG